jgi:hypothetical protein
LSAVLPVVVLLVLGVAAAEIERPALDGWHAPRSCPDLRGEWTALDLQG